MKSKLMKHGIPKGLHEDLRILSEISTEAFTKLISSLDKSTTSGWGFPLSDFRAVSEITDTSVESLSRALKIAGFISTQIENRNDSLEDILDDLLIDKILNEAQIASVSSKMKIAERFLKDKVSRFSQLQEIVSNTFPTLQYLQSRCSIITKFNKEFERNKDKPETYSPKVTQVTPVAVIQLDIDRFDEIEHVSFALTEPELNELIQHLQLAKVQLRSLANHLSIGDQQDGKPKKAR